jgi:hypothetical protein
MVRTFFKITYFSVFSIDLFPKSVFSVFFTPRNKFQGQKPKQAEAGYIFSLLQQTSAYSRAIYRSALKNQG